MCCCYGPLSSRRDGDKVFRFRVRTRPDTGSYFAPCGAEWLRSDNSVVATLIVEDVGVSFRMLSSTRCHLLGILAPSNPLHLPDDYMILPYHGPVPCNGTGLHQILKAKTPGDYPSGNESQRIEHSSHRS